MNQLARAPLPKGVNIVGDRIGLNYRIDRKSATRNFVDQSQKATRIEFDQLKNTYYSLNESRTKTDADNKQPKLHSAKNPTKLNSKLRKSFYQLSNEEKQRHHYSTMEKVHDLWQQYAKKVLNDADQMSIVRMELHGCKLQCTASKNPTLVGSEGIVVQETRNTFLIITLTNRLLTLPKRESLFEFKVGQNVYKIHGCNLLFTTQNRSKVKKRQHKCLLDI